MSKLFLSRRRVVAAGIALATIIGFGSASTIATTAPAVAKGNGNGNGNGNSGITVTQQPTAVSVAAGQDASFTAAATADPAPTVQWMQCTSGCGNGDTAAYSAINGQTGLTLTLVGVTAGMNGNYYLAVFTSGGQTAWTDRAKLTVTAPVNTAPQVTTNPSNATVTAGSNASFTAAASGSPSPAVQWQLSTDGGNTWNDVAGATSATLPVSTTSAMDGNQYRAVFTNSAGTATTSAATLTVQYAPQVATNPADQSVTEGGTATFTAAATGDPSPTVQWKVSTDNGNTWNDVAGANSTTLTLPAVTIGMSGNQYRAVFTNSVDTATTTAATLTVTAAQTKPVIAAGGNPADATVVAGQTATFTASATGNPTPDVQWWVCTRNCSRDRNWSEVSVGGTATTLSFTTSAADSGNEYRAVFTNSAGSVTSGSATLTVTTPATVTDPRSQTVVAGFPATFTTHAGGNPAPSLQWQVNEGAGWTDVAGATGSSLTVSTDQGMNGYLYRVVANGTVTSGEATLTVLYAPVVTTDPTSQKVPEGTDVTFTAAADANPAATVQWQVYVSVAPVCVPVIGCIDFSHWQNIDGATSTSLTLNNVSLSMDGNQYRAVFTNPVLPWFANTQSATLNVTALTAVTPSVTDGFTITQATCAAPTPTVQVNDPAPAGLTYSVDPTGGYTAGGTMTITATLASGYKFGALPNGWTLAAGGQSATDTYTFDALGKCETAFLGNPPVTSIAACNTYGSIVHPWNDGVDYTISPNATYNGDPGVNAWVGLSGTYTITATLNSADYYQFGNTAGWTVDGRTATTTRNVGTYTACGYVGPLHVTSIAACNTYGSIVHPWNDGVDYTISPNATYNGDPSVNAWVDLSGTYTVTATAKNGYTLALPSSDPGWSLNADRTVATHTADIGTYSLCDAAPQLPTVTQAVCTGPGTSSLATVVAATTPGVTYTVAGDLSTVTAALQSGYQWQADEFQGWTKGEQNTLVYTVPLTSPGACLVGATPLAVTAQAGSCDTTTGFDSPATITSPTDGLDEDGITYRVAGLTVTATADPGYQIAGTDGWVNGDGVWTYTASVTQPQCSSVVELPGSVPAATGTGTLTGVPPTTNPGQQLNVTGTGFAPNATVNFGIYSTPLLLATVSADVHGVAKATIVIPADFLGDHTVVAAGWTSAGTAGFLTAKTTVVKKTQASPGDSGAGVAGVSTSRGPGTGPNAGSTSPLADTGTPANPIALGQIALLAILAGAGLLVAARRRRAHRH